MRLLCLVLLASACTGDDGGTGQPGDTSAHKFCVDETNRYRAMKGKPAETRSTQLETYADTGAMVDFSGQPHQHFSSTGGGGIATAENECPHWNLQMAGGDMNMLVAQCIAAFFSEGPGGGHYENMMSGRTQLGCGIFESNGSVTIVQDYGQ